MAKFAGAITGSRENYSEKILTVLQVVNSIVSKPGNIAVRTGYIIRSPSSPVTACICRASLAKVSNVKIASMGPLSYVSRALNYLRNYFPRFDHRGIDIALFELHFFISYFVIGVGRDCNIVHLWEYSPRIIRWLKACNIRVILDVPIAPAEYAKRRYGMTNRFIVFDAHIRRERQCFKLVDEIFSPSAFVSDALIQVGVKADKITTIEFGSDKRASGEGNMPEPILNNGCHYIFAGALNARKGLDLLLSVWEEWPYAQDVLHLCGHMTPFCKSELNRNFNATVVTPGFVDTGAYFQGKHVFVFPSLLEGSAKVVFEALASGLLCIVTNESGSVIRNEIDGLVIECDNISQLRLAMLQARNDGVVADYAEAAARRANEFSWERYVCRVCEAYDA